jgi:hypothetical protein
LYFLSAKKAAEQGVYCGPIVSTTPKIEEETSMEFRFARITIAALGLLGGVARAAVVTTSLQQPLTATVFFRATSELVDLTGNIHTVAHVTTDPTCFPPGPCVVRISIHTNLDGVTGIGQMTGMRYIVTGAFDSDSMTTIPGQVIEIMSFSFGVENPISTGHSNGDRQGKVSITEVTIFDITGIMVSAQVFGLCGPTGECLTAYNAPVVREPQPVSLPRGREVAQLSQLGQRLRYD